MERSSKPSIINISKLLPIPNATCTVNHVSPPLSPHKVSPPIFISIIPSEARKKPNYGSSFDTKEPTSPKVSCLGHVNIKKKKPNSKPKSKPKLICGGQQEGTVVKVHRKVTPKVVEKDDPKKFDKVPSLGDMKRYVSGRGGALSDFDWTITNNPTFVAHDISHKLRVKV